jgi:hypothetical protein
MVRRIVLISLCIFAVAGCYREPENQGAAGTRADDASADQQANGDAMSPDTVLSPPPKSQKIIESRSVALGPKRLTAPDDWTRKSASNRFVMTEFTLDKVEGDPKDGRLTVSTARGGIEPNIERWKGQFVPEPEATSRETIEVDDIEITVVDFSGTYNDARGPFMPGTEREDYRMLAAIIPLEGQLYFVKGYGPEKTMAAHEDRFYEFIRSLEPAGDKPQE